MTGQLCYEDVAIGAELPTIARMPTPKQLVKWAGASGDFYEIHYDRDFARQTGLADVIVHGRLKAAFLLRMAELWIGAQGRVRKINARFREMDYPGQQMLCRGKVTAKYVRDGECWIECDVWTENPKGQQTTTGSLAVTLPSRGGGGS